MPTQVLIADLYPTAVLISPPPPPLPTSNEWNQLFKLPYASYVEAWKQEKLVYIPSLTWFKWYDVFFWEQQVNVHHNGSK